MNRLNLLEELNQTSESLCDTEAGSAVGQSWVCASFPERGWPEPRWWFLYISQFNRDTPFWGYLEAAVTASICLAGIPANLVAAFNFQKRRVRQAFFLLVITLTICNVMFCLFGLMVAVVRLGVDWPWHYIGCAGFFYGSLVTICMSLWTMALISIERRICITNRDKSKQLSIRFVTITLILMTIFDIAIWSFPAFYLRVADLKDIYVPGAKLGEDGDMVRVCSLFSYRFQIGAYQHTRYVRGTVIQASLMLLTTMIVPLPLVIYNYWVIMRSIRELTNKFSPFSRAASVVASSAENRKSNSSLFALDMNKSNSLSRGDQCDRNQNSFDYGDPSSAAVARPTHFSSCFLRCRRRELYLTKLMIVILVLFIACTTPINAVTLYAAISSRRYDVQSSYFVIALLFVYINATLSPLLQSLSPGFLRSMRSRICPNSSGGTSVKNRRLTFFASFNSSKSESRNSNQPQQQTTPASSQSCTETYLLPRNETQVSFQHGGKNSPS